jgi:DNA-binding transcriptional regulator/RsmH inhibitor MraZ
MCALSSDLAIQCLLAGTAKPDALFQHSLTGTVETVDVDASGRMVVSTRLCRDVIEDGQWL